MIKENWIEIKGFSSYLIDPYNCKIMNKNTKNILTPIKNKGYLYIILKNDNNELKTVTVHRLFLHLLPGKGGFVNHKDGNKLNWHIDNLELVSRSENMRHAIDVLGKMRNNRGNHIKKPIIAINTINNEQLLFNSLKEAGEYLNIDRRHISAILKDKQKTAKRWTFQYQQQPTIDLSNFFEYPNNPNYMISKDGKIFSKKRNTFITTKKIGNYIGVNTNKLSSCYLHRILAEMFIPNPKNYPIVDHIDRNPLNNSLNNLRWASIHINANNKNHNITNKIPIAAIKDNKIFKIYDSISAVKNDGYPEGMVRKYINSGKIYKEMIWNKITNENCENYINKL